MLDIGKTSTEEVERILGFASLAWLVRLRATERPCHKESRWNSETIWGCPLISLHPLTHSYIQSNTQAHTQFLSWYKKLLLFPDSTIPLQCWYDKHHDKHQLFPRVLGIKLTSTFYQLSPHQSYKVCLGVSRHAWQNHWSHDRALCSYACVGAHTHLCGDQRSTLGVMNLSLNLELAMWLAGCLGSSRDCPVSFPALGS